MYNLIYEYLLQDYVKMQHRAEVEAARKAREENKPITYTGVVTKEMKEAAKRKDDKQIGHREVYAYLCDESNRFSKENPIPKDVQSQNYKAGEKGPKSEQKLDLGKLCNYLAKVPIPGFEEPFEEPIIHLMFHQLETKREQGISFGDFKKLITDAAMDSRVKDTVDYLHGDDIFAYLLHEENSRHRGLVFENYKVRESQDPPDCPEILVVGANLGGPLENDDARASRRAVRSIETIEDEEKEVLHDIGNVIVGDAVIVEHEEDVGQVDDVKDDGTAETNANTSINADEIGDNYVNRDDAGANGTENKDISVQEPSIFNLFGLW